MAKWRREQLEDTRAIRQAVNRYGIYRLLEKKLEVCSSKYGSKGSIG